MRKEIEERAEEYVRNNVMWGKSMVSAMKAYIAGAREALAGQWISVNDRLPDQRQAVAYVSRYEPTKGVVHYIYGGSDSFLTFDHLNDEKSQVVAWMPLPKFDPSILE